MDQNHNAEPAWAPAGVQNADAGAPTSGARPERRNSARRKLAAVTRLLRGEPLETVARELNVTVARLSEWRDRALVAAEAAMKERERCSRDEELLRVLVAKRLEKGRFVWPHATNGVVSLTPAMLSMLLEGID
jgi:hypothetical protein